jgi:hypothetical protein
MAFICSNTDRVLPLTASSECTANAVRKQLLQHAGVECLISRDLVIGTLRASVEGSSRRYE